MARTLTTPGPAANPRSALADVRARIAAAWFRADTTPHTAGGFTLRPAQRTAVASVHRALAAYGGALLADPPGTGKTVIALAVAGAYDDALVVAPSTLRGHWERAAAHAAIRMRFISVEALSRDTAPAPATLLIVDEAHHLRSPGTRRFARAAALATTAHVLLLTATPVVNRRADRDTLLSLFLGDRAATLDAHTLARVIVCRDGDRALLPPVRTLPPLRTGSDRAVIGDRLQALPPPFPAADGREALALIRVTLAMAWSSSLAALDAALRRRMQRGESLGAVLGAGRWPTRDALRAWVIGDDATQLAFPELTPTGDRVPPTDALRALHRHLDAVRRLRAEVTPRVARDTGIRADAVRAVADAHPTTRLVLFARHAETVRALWRAMRGWGGVVAVTGERVHAAQGRWSRAELLRALGPHAEPWRRDDPRGIRMVLATDFLSEGVELQGAGILVHGDSVWTPARLEQRVGRLVRAGSTRREVLVTSFVVPAGAQQLLRLDARLQRKERARVGAVADARSAEAIGVRFRTWAEAAERGTPGGPRIAATRAAVDGYVAAVRLGAEVRVVGGLQRAAGYRVSASPDGLRALLDASSDAPCVAAPDAVRRARRALQRWGLRALAAARSGQARGRDIARWRQAQHRIDRALASTPFAARGALARQVHDALHALLASPGVGTMRGVRRALHEARDPAAFARALIALAKGAGTRPATGAAATPRPVLEALLLLSAERSSPPAASPNSAAPR